MKELPLILQPLRSQAEVYLQENLVKEIEFSQSTYQILVIDRESGKEAWTFLQFNKDNSLGDCFCNFEDSEHFEPCVHLCAAYLKLHSEKNELLHVRFERSLWNRLCLIFCKKLGTRPKDIFVRIEKGHYAYLSPSGTPIFSIIVKTKEIRNHLKNILIASVSATEENSLKFSNLSPEELEQWKEGHPANHLKYQLSFWSDIAKWLMVLQEDQGHYSITYEYGDDKLPNRLNVSFDELALSFFISRETLAQIIPYLNSVKSPLKVFKALDEEILKIEYNKKEKSFFFSLKKGTQSPHEVIKDLHPESIAIDRWLFVPDEGFYTKDPHEVLSGDQVYAAEEALNEYMPFLKKHLVDVKIHSNPQSLSYTLHFDPEWNLHIHGYLFTPGDLDTLDSHYFGNWAYIDGDGFYKLESPYFENLETLIPESGIVEFIAAHRKWLNQQPEFSLHLSGLESELTYKVDANNRLHFLPSLTQKEKKGTSHDFDPWIYIAKEGFYSKKATSLPISIQPGTVWNEAQIPFLIKVNEKSLDLLPGFFSALSPILGPTLSLEFSEKEKQLLLEPGYTIRPEYKKRGVRFFDDYCYVEGEGFHEISPFQKLPDKYRHAVYLQGDDLISFIKEDLEKLTPYIDNLDKRLQKPQKMLLSIAAIDKNENSSYAALLKYQTDIGDVPATAIWTEIKKKNRLFFSPAGLIYLDDKRFRWLKWLKTKQLDRRSQRIELSTIELLRLLAFEEIDLDNSERSAKSTKSLKDLLEFKVPQDPDLSELKSCLRPYQQVGIKWLWFLRSHGLSGLLCDDMGLGKTHQAMALIAAIRHDIQQKEKEEKLPFLVVCPTSVIYHWEEKLKQFLPDLRVSTFYGSERSLEDFHKDYDLLLTSYGICRIENNLLSEITFELAIFDEIQIAKNHNSRTYSALATLNAKMRLGLTGTPIENHLRELKALFDLIIPLYMPSDAEFREIFVRPIEKEGSVKQKKLLEKMIKPFVTRRKKEDVLTDLPEKIEEISHCDLTEEQAALYNEVVLLGRARILEEIEGSESKLPYIHIFALLSSLKQICNHPASYLKCPNKYKEFSSGKWDLFLELLSEARESGQKVVVYSQYLQMLDIIESYLKEEGIKFSAIRGSTTNRKEQLQRFKEDPTYEVFVGSLQATGLGIDLTAASVVIHYDRWWNAARENQATDRVHRIGQKKGVQVFKLVTKDTFEERIDEIISRKGRFMEEIVGVDEHEFIKKFTRDELIEFLKETKHPTDHNN